MQPEEDSFIEELFQKHFTQLCKYAAIHLSDSQHAEDIVQDAFHEAVNKIDEVMDHPAPEKWLKKVVKYKVLNHERVRRRMLRHLISTEDISTIPDPDSVEEAAIGRNTPPLILRAKEILEEDDFYLLMRVAFENASHAQIAKELGITVWTSSQRLSRIRKKLKEEFRKNF